VAWVGIPSSVKSAVAVMRDQARDCSGNCTSVDDSSTLPVISKSRSTVIHISPTPVSSTTRDTWVIWNTHKGHRMSSESGKHIRRRNGQVLERRRDSHTLIDEPTVSAPVCTTPLCLGDSRTLAYISHGNGLLRNCLIVRHQQGTKHEKGGYLEGAIVKKHIVAVPPSFKAPVLSTCSRHARIICIYSAKQITLELDALPFRWPLYGVHLTILKTVAFSETPTSSPRADSSSLREPLPPSRRTITTSQKDTK
jgi:hypothetical protein